MSIHLIVTYADHQTGFYPVPEGEGWRVDAALRCLVIGRGVPRTYVPLDGVQCFAIEECGRPDDFATETTRTKEETA